MKIGDYVSIENTSAFGIIMAIRNYRHNDVTKYVDVDVYGHGVQTHYDEFLRVITKEQYFQNCVEM